MKQCVAITKDKDRCKRPASDGCGRYCKNHFKLLDSSEKEKELGRSELRNKLGEVRRQIVGAGRITLEVGGAVALAKELWDIFGPLLLFASERNYFQVLLNPSAPSEEKLRALKLLSYSLSMHPAREFEWVYQSAEYQDER